MRGFVKYEAGPRQQIVRRRIVRKEHSIFAEECRAGMFHSAVGEFRNDDQIILSPRVRVIEIFGQSANPFAIETSYLIKFRSGFRLFRSSRKEAHRHISALDLKLKKRACGESEEICA